MATKKAPCVFARSLKSSVVELDGTLEPQHKCIVDMSNLNN